MTDYDRIIRRITEQIKTCDEEDADWIYVPVWMGKKILKVMKEHKWMGNENRCVCCGEVIPEGRQVCPGCETAEEPKPWKRLWTAPDGTYKGRCDHCGFVHYFIHGHGEQYKFCPQCGEKKK